MAVNGSERSRTHPAWLAVIALIAVAALLAACAGASTGERAPVADSDEQPRDGAGQAPDGEEPPLANIVDRQIVKTGEITIEVDSVAAAVGELRAMALDLGGYVGGSRAGDVDEPATLTLRIPADRFDAALTRLHEMAGEVRAEATREEDVTGTVVDLEARIRNLEASEAQYRSLLDRASEIEDILTVQSRLDEVRGRIEQLQAQLDQLSGQASLATLTVTVVPAAAPVEATAASWEAGAIFDSAVAALVGLGQIVATMAIWLAVVGVPLAIVAGAITLVAVRAAPSIRRRPAAPGD